MPSDYKLVQMDKLVLQDKNGQVVLSIDFSHGELRHRVLYGGNRNSVLARAIGAHNRRNAPRVLDATAGLGRDSFILASLGCRVTMLERSPVLHALLDDALRRGREDIEILDAVSGMSLVRCDAKEYLLTAITAQNNFDVIYLDPMFPHEKRTALVKKEMRICRELVGDDTDADELLPIALKTPIKRVVVKRMRTAPYMAGIKPNQQILGKTNRFDLYLR